MNNFSLNRPFYCEDFNCVSVKNLNGWYPDIVHTKYIRSTGNRPQHCDLGGCKNIFCPTTHKKSFCAINLQRVIYRETKDEKMLLRDTSLFSEMCHMTYHNSYIQLSGTVPPLLSPIYGATRKFPSPTSSLFQVLILLLI